jgi:methyl-accepting chemotaxis protein
VDVIDGMVSQIATATEEQTAVTEEINRNVSSINHIAESVSENSTHNIEATDQIAMLSEKLQKLMGRFTV